MEDNEFRVNVKQKSIVTEQLTKYKSLLMMLLDGQSQLNEDEKKLLQEALTFTFQRDLFVKKGQTLDASSTCRFTNHHTNTYRYNSEQQSHTDMNFETAVQQNILVNGLSWDDAPEENSEDSECNTLDDLLDEKIVQTTWKRSAYPQKILPYVVRSLKAERSLMNMYENSIKPQEVKRDPNQVTIMINVTAAAPTMFKQASTVMKSLKAQKQTMEGLHQVLNMQPSAKTLETYRDVFSGSNDKSHVFCNRQPVNKSTIQRALVETEYSMDYVPVIEHPHTSTHDD